MARTTKDFNQFKQSAEKLDTKFNVHHLKTEYNLAHSVAQSGSTVSERHSICLTLYSGHCFTVE